MNDPPSVISDTAVCLFGPHQFWGGNLSSRQRNRQNHDLPRGSH